MTIHEALAAAGEGGEIRRPTGDPEEHLWRWLRAPGGLVQSYLAYGDEVPPPDRWGAVMLRLADVLATTWEPATRATVMLAAEPDSRSADERGEMAMSTPTGKMPRPYRRRLEEVQAFQWHRVSDAPAIVGPLGSSPENTNYDAECPGRQRGVCTSCMSHVYKHGWLSRTHVDGEAVCPGNWIVAHADGTRTVMTEDAFQRAYGPVEGATEPVAPPADRPTRGEVRRALGRTRALDDDDDDDDAIDEVMLELGGRWPAMFREEEED